jgi:hypothetical protein
MIIMVIHWFFSGSASSRGSFCGNFVTTCELALENETAGVLVVVQNILFVYLMIYLTVGGQRSQKSSIFTTKKIVGVLRLVLCDTWDETVKIVTIYSLRSNYTLLRSNKIELNFFKTSA